jgi:hypothetical protein
MTAGDVVQNSRSTGLGNAPGARPIRWERRWLIRWIVVVTLAEAVGFVAPALVGVLAAQSPAFVPLLLVAGAVEGAVLGGAQALVLRRRLPALRRRAWVLLTVAGALVAYGAGLLPSMLEPIWTQWSAPAQAGLLMGSVAVILLSIGTAQWIELRRHVTRAAWWIAGTAGAWLVALALFLAIATPLWQEGQDAAIAVLIGVAAGAVMAAAMAAVTGLTLEVLLHRPIE